MYPLPLQPPSHAHLSPSPLWATAEHELSCLYCSCLLAMYFTHANVLAILLSQFTPPSSAPVSTCPLLLLICFCPGGQFICTILPDSIFMSSLVIQFVKSPPSMKETWIQSPGQEDPLKDLATHSSVLAWRTPWTEEPGGLQSMG